jgi:hypothetical protein
MTTQPEALRLADELEMWTLGEPAAAELRRLCAQRDALLEALKLARPYISTYTMDGYHAEVNADAAIKAAEEEA